MPIRITGIDRVIKANGKATAKISKTIQEALHKCAEVLLNKSKELVPVDTSALKESGTIISVGSGLGAVSQVSYGGPDAPYAYIVHERLDVYHEPPTQARYLADAIPKVRGTMTAIIRRQVSVT